MNAKHRIKKSALIVLKPGTKRYRLSRKIAEIVGLTTPSGKAEYAEWIERTEPLTWSEYIEHKYKPKISIIVPVFNPPAKYFFPMIYSVVNQTYQNWEIILINASNDKRSKDITDDCVGIDSRIMIANIKKNKGIAENTNYGIKYATGDYVALLDHDDVLAPQALHEMVCLLQNGQLASIVYSDEDKITANGEERYDPHFKPDWSPLLLREVNYINHFSIIRKDVLLSIGGYRTGFDGAQDYDLYLRVIDVDSNVLHVPKILYHWRAAETSTARNFSVKDNILNSGVRALNDHLIRNNITANVLPVAEQPGFYEVKYHIDKNEKYTVIIIPSEPKTQYKKLVNLLLSLRVSDRIQYILGNMPENPVDQHNSIIEFVEATSTLDFMKKAKKLIQTEYVVIIDSGVVPLKGNWIDTLVGPLIQDKTISIVTPILLDSSMRTIYDAGLVSVGDSYTNLFKGVGDREHTIFGNSNWSRNLDSITGNCFAIRHQNFDSAIDCYQNGKINAKLVHDMIKKDKTQILLNGFAVLLFAGRSHLYSKKTRLFSPNIIAKKGKYGLIKMINIPEKEVIDD